MYNAIIEIYKELKMNMIKKVEGANIQKNDIESTIEQKDAVASLFALIEALSFEVCSGDVWFLAMHSAKQIATQKYGVSEEVFLEMMSRVEKARKAKNKQNPMSSMF